MKDVQLNLLRVDLKPKPLAFNERKEAALMLFDVGSKCMQLAIILNAFPGVGVDELSLETCAELVEVSELLDLGRTDD